MKPYAATLVLTIFTISPAHGQNSSQTYRLNPESRYLTTCTAPCTCPAPEEMPLRGTFRLTYSGTDSSGAHYLVEDVAWVAESPSTGEMTPLVGAGSFRREDAAVGGQQMTLDLTIGVLTVIHHFDSGLVPAGALWPEIDLVLASGNQSCQESELRIHASPAGACCLLTPDALSPYCEARSEAACLADGGVYHGDHSTCENRECEPPIGACCIENDPSEAACMEGIEAECISMSGWYQGNGTTCDSAEVVCGSPPGACCFMHTATGQPICAIHTAAECVTYGGLFQGAETVCSNTMCNCCFENASCTTMPPVACIDEGGTVFQSGDPIPALGEWGLAVLAVLVLTAGSLLHRRSVRVAD